MSRQPAIVAVLLVACLAACGPPSEGTVTAKKHHGAWTQMLNAGKTWVPIYHPERWSIRITDGDNSGWEDVSEAEYDRTPIGAKWTEGYR